MTTPAIHQIAPARVRDPAAFPADIDALYELPKRPNLLGGFRADRRVLAPTTNFVTDWQNLKPGGPSYVQAVVAERPEYFDGGGPDDKPRLRFANTANQSLDPAGGLTIAAGAAFCIVSVVKFDDVAANYQFWGHVNGSNERRVQYDTNGRIVLTVGLAGSVIRATDVAPGEWHVIVAAHDGTTNTNSMRLYVDDRNAVYGTAAANANASLLTIGNNASFKGDVAEHWIFSADISRSAVQADVDTRAMLHSNMRARYSLLMSQAWLDGV
jgi:hypothetical protein